LRHMQRRLKRLDEVILTTKLRPRCHISHTLFFDRRALAIEPRSSDRSAPSGLS
jgi:hypothetical protein